MQDPSAAGSLQRRHCVWQVFSQHRPSTQNPLWHSTFVVHGAA
jgi:hypothetical protein